MLIESLETRRLLTTTISGTAGPDEIVVQVNGTTFVAIVNGTTIPISSDPSVRIAAGAGNDSIRIRELPPNRTITIDDGLDDDTVTLGDVPFGLSNLKSPVSMLDALGQDTLILNDEVDYTSATARTYEVVPGQVTGPGFSPITFASIQGLELHLGTSTNTVNVNPDPSVPITIRGDLPGSGANDRLVITPGGLPGQAMILNDFDAGIFVFNTRQPVQFYGMEAVGNVPATTTNAYLATASQTGTDPSATNLENVTLTGTASLPSATVMVELRKTAAAHFVYYPIADASGNWTQAFTFSSGEGSYVVRTRVVTNNGYGTSDGTHPLVFDQTAPLAPAIPDLNYGDDTGYSNTDNVTKLTRLSFQGTYTSGQGGKVYPVVDGVTQYGAPLSGNTSGPTSYNLMPLVLSEGVHSIAARFVDQAGNLGAISSSLTVTVDLTAPQAVSGSGRFLYEAVSPVYLTQRVDHGFSEPITMKTYLPGESYSDDDYFTLTNLTTNTLLRLNAYGYGGSSLGTYFFLNPRSIFADGNYRLSFTPGGFLDVAGNALTQSLSFDFFVLAGDANRDRTVNFDDLLVMAQNYGASGKTFGQGNFDYSTDGAVTFDDLLILAQRYGITLPAPAAFATPQATTPTNPINAAKAHQRMCLPESTFVSARKRDDRTRSEGRESPVDSAPKNLNAGRRALLGGGRCVRLRRGGLSSRLEGEPFQNANPEHGKRHAEDHDPLGGQARVAVPGPDEQEADQSHKEAREEDRQRRVFPPPPYCLG